MPCDTGAMEPTPAVSVTRSDERHRWELVVDGEVVAFAEFVGDDDPVTIPYIETAAQHRGQGYSTALMLGVAEDLRRRGRSVRATCPVARGLLAERAPDVLVR